MTIASPIPTVLVSEAYPALQESFQLLLEDWTSVQLVATPEECLDALAQAHPDLLILDLDGCAMDPFRFLEAIRAISPTLKVLLVAGHFELAFQMALLTFGRISFLAKPLQPTVALDKLRTLLGHPSAIHTRVLRLAFSPSAVRAVARGE